MFCKVQNVVQCSYGVMLGVIHSNISVNLPLGVSSLATKIKHIYIDKEQIFIVTRCHN